ncbi:hypothetical protein BLNAU_14623 [Blattamonas nauphoetae]|uniref:Uncharacterized protein n=1 Tax=Blattamonas nauphoetae TaxID=2049346 RepID=A0ABQ9XH14_9EUKA|nr:hypothetical protein BLNAU_14623 [Blattamonas nauphoetae]
MNEGHPARDLQTFPSHFSKASCTVSERLIGNTIEQVENCLFGTVSSPLGTHLSFASSSCSQLFIVQDSAPLFQAANCIFEKQSTSGSGSVLNYTSAYVVLHLFDCLFSSNSAKTNGGALATHQGIHDMHRCVFKDNTAGTRGGAICFYWPINLVFMEDCHFSNNVALEYNSNNESYTHYRGNDVHLVTKYHSSMITESIVGCSSDSALPRIGYFDSPPINGFHPSQELLLPSPTPVSIPPPAASTFFVDISAPSSNTECTKESPCPTLSQALAKTGSGFKLIDIGMGNHTDSSTSLSGSVGIVGAGWLTNSSAYTNLTSAGFAVSAPSSNVSLTAFSLFPPTPTTILSSGISEMGTKLA